MQNAFYRLEGGEAEAMLSTVSPHVRDAGFEAASTAVLVCDLPFYPGCRLVDLTSHGHVPHQKRSAVVAAGGAVTMLDWTNAPIYALNETVPIALARSNVADYVRFFFGYVRGLNGAFRIVEAAADIDWREDPPAQSRRAVGRMLQPVQVMGKAGHDGSFSLFACMVHREALFRVTVTVDGKGRIAAGEEELLAEGMPVRDQRFGF